MQKGTYLSPIGVMLGYLMRDLHGGSSVMPRGSTCLAERDFAHRIFSEPEWGSTWLAEEGFAHGIFSEQERGNAWVEEQGFARWIVCERECGHPRMGEGGVTSGSNQLTEGANWTMCLAVLRLEHSTCRVAARPLLRCAM